MDYILVKVYAHKLTHNFVLLSRVPHPNISCNETAGGGLSPRLITQSRLNEFATTGKEGRATSPFDSPQ